MYKIKDLQIAGREFADGAIYKTKEDVREQLIDYHLIDCEDVDILENMSLDEILEYGEWAIEEIHCPNEKENKTICNLGYACDGCPYNQEIK